MLSSPRWLKKVKASWLLFYKYFIPNGIRNGIGLQSTPLVVAVADRRFILISESWSRSANLAFRGNQQFSWRLMSGLKVWAIRPFNTFMNRRFINAAGLVASLHFLLWWACAGFLRATGFRLFTFESLFGFAPSPHHSLFQDLAFVIQGVISFPAASLPAWGDSRLLDCLLLISNSIVWGICIGFLIYALRQRIWRRKTVA